MAVQCSSSPHIIIIQKTWSITKPINKLLMIKRSHDQQVPFKKALSLKIRSSFKTKVFEDKCEGIICYRDELSGEIVCEGYDEGPRFHQQLLPETTDHSRDAEILNILLQRWNEIVNGGGGGGEIINNADHKGGGVVQEEDIKWNGFNTY
ncbi:hypothetical protein LWI29_001821 [Acer saccharum]|uniref:Uncharacterized protein n=1 Tax=Acer saccharum TaxID=4024 RepID=A0AA39SKY5_ACESA|nr:hypothetical protein LWI29_001821 [Acer saccharum]KAK1574946.1 hypothetical protein Q3G72_001223 [Acer saccharum]